MIFFWVRRIEQHLLDQSCQFCRANFCFPTRLTGYLRSTNHLSALLTATCCKHVFHRGGSTPLSAANSVVTMITGVPILDSRSCLVALKPAFLVGELVYSTTTTRQRHGPVTEPGGCTCDVDYDHGWLKKTAELLQRRVVQLPSKIGIWWFISNHQQIIEYVYDQPSTHYESIVHNQYKPVPISYQ